MFSTIQGMQMAGNQINYNLDDFLERYPVSDPPYDYTMSRFYFVIEIIFLVEMILNFFTEFPAEGGKTLFENKKPVRDIFKIARRYLNTSFIFDLVSTIPFSFFIEPKREGVMTLMNYDFFYLLYLLKI